MVLMTCLLFCALVPYLPHSLGYSAKHFPLHIQNEVNINDNVIIVQQKPQVDKILFEKTPPSFRSITDLQYIFRDVRCKRCIVCLEEALQVYNMHSQILKQPITSVNAIKDILKNEYGLKSRFKRDSNIEHKNSSRFKRKRRSKKKTNTSITITKYYGFDKEVHGIKIKESTSGNNSKENEIQTCTVYGITESYDCFTPEGNTFIESVKRKKSRQAPEITTRGTMGFSMPYYKIREIDSTQPTNDDSASSIEDML